MPDAQLARQLLLAELSKEQGRFVTQRIVDRLRIFHAAQFDGGFLAGLAEEINREIQRKGIPLRDPAPAE